MQIGNSAKALESLNTARERVAALAEKLKSGNISYQETKPEITDSVSAMQTAWQDFVAYKPAHTDESRELIHRSVDLHGLQGRWLGWTQFDTARTVVDLGKYDEAKHALDAIDGAIKVASEGSPDVAPAGFSDAARAVTYLTSARQHTVTMAAKVDAAHGGTLSIDEVGKLGDEASEALRNAAESMARAPEELRTTMLVNDHAHQLRQSVDHLRGWKDIKKTNDLGVGTGWNFAHNATRDIDRALSELRATLGVKQATQSDRWTPPAMSDALEEYGTDLTARAANNELHELVGRGAETNALIDAVKNGSGIIVGEPGTGKTAIAEGLAQRIVEGDVPAELQGTRIFSLDTNKLGMTSGIVGDGEKRMQAFLDAVMKDDVPVVVFIDEIHNLMGVGAYKGHNVGLEQVLKPYMADGRLRIIGATTTDEYTKYIEPDGAFARRMTKIQIDEPSKEDTLYILRTRFAEHDKVQIDDDALTSALSLSERLYPDRYQPDKAIKLVDATIKRRLREIDGKPEELLKLEDAVARTTVEVAALKRSPNPAPTRVAEAEARLAAATTQRDELTAKYDLARFGDPETLKSYQDVQLKLEGDPDDTKLAQQLDELGAQLQAQRLEGRRAFPGMDRTSLTAADIAAVAGTQTGVRAGTATADTKVLLDTLPDAIDKRIVGQAAAKDAFTRVIRRSYSPFRDPERPRGIVLALGPTGVGKTHLAEVVAEHMGSEAITVDMSQYSERHSVSNLWGPPKGYIGYDEGGELTGAARRNPDAFIILDEVEKAHRDVWDGGLPLFEEGRLTDTKLGEVSFKNNTIVMTSNLRTEADLKGYFRPELLNRIDEIVVFGQLDAEAIRTIVDLQLGIMQSRAPRIKLDVTDAAKAELARVGFDPEMGARPVRRAIQKNVEDVLAPHLIGVNPDAGGVAKVDFVPGTGFTGSFAPAA